MKRRHLLPFGAWLMFHSAIASAAELGRPSGIAEESVPSLARVLTLAKERAPDVLVGRAHVGVARSGLVGARLPWVGNPYVELTADRHPTENDKKIAVLGVAWLPFELAGQRGARIDEANAQVAYAEKGVAYARALAVAEALVAYGKAVVGSERLRVLGDLTDVARAESEHYSERFKAGDATAQDARLAELDMARYGVMVEEARADVAAALTRIESITGSLYADAPTEPLHPPDIDTRDAATGAPGVMLSQAEAKVHDRTKDKWKREGWGALSLILLGGTNDLGEPRVGAGLGYSFPIFHSHQGEQAVAEAERSRAMIEAQVQRRVIFTRLAGLGRELTQVRRALEVIRDQAEPAALAAVEAAMDMRRLGKGELLVVLTSRRDLALLRLSRLDLVAREWEIQGETIAMTGRLP